MPQNNYKEVIGEFKDYAKNIYIENFMKNVDEIEQILNYLGFKTVEQLKDNIVNDELKSN